MYQTHDLLAIQRRFPTELACRQHLEQQRWTDGFRCPRCRHDRAGYHRARRLYRCRRCRTDVSLTAGTIFHKTHTPLTTWFWLILLMSQNKHGVSMLQAQQLLDIGSYKTIWSLTHKIRTAMAARDARYQLAGLVELDESYFGGVRPGKRGRGAAGKRPVLVAVSTTAQGRPAFAKMAVVPTVDVGSTQQVVSTAIQPGQTVKTDGLGVYPAALCNGYRHQPQRQGTPERASVILPGVHLIIANAKRFLQGTHHREAPKHLQRFLDEFAYRLNRRWCQGQLFDRLLTACATAPSITFRELRK